MNREKSARQKRNGENESIWHDLRLMLKLFILIWPCLLLSMKDKTLSSQIMFKNSERFAVGIFFFIVDRLYFTFHEFRLL